MKITNEGEYQQSLSRCAGLREQIFTQRTEIRELEIDIFNYQESDEYHKDRNSANCEMRSREFDNLKSEKGDGK